MIIIKRTTLFLAGILLVSSCGSADENTKTEEKKTPIIQTETSNIYSSAEFNFMLPSPFALVSSFERAGLEFEGSRMNNPKNTDKYNTEGKQLLNFGVYSADLVYSIINDQTQSSINNFNAIKKIADKLGMGSIFNEEELAKEIEKNITNREEMQDLLIDVHENSQDYLENNEMRVLAAIQFSGAWVEGMYLATFDLDKKDEVQMSHNIVDHMNLLKHAVKGLESFKEREKDLDNVLSEMKELQNMYNELESVKDVKGLPELNNKEIKVIADKIHAIRHLITA